MLAGRSSGWLCPFRALWPAIPRECTSLDLFEFYGCYNGVLSMTQCIDDTVTLFTFFIFDFALIFLSISHVLSCHDKKGNSVQNADAVRDLI